MTGHPVFADWVDPAWMAHAGCQGMDTNLFYFERGGGGSNTADGKALRQVCADCSVQTDCLAYAMKHEIHGFWGGLSEQERSRERVRRGGTRRRLGAA